MPKVSITLAGHEVHVESDADTLDAVASKALDLFTASKDPALVRGFGTTGFTAERADVDVDEAFRR